MTTRDYLKSNGIFKSHAEIKLGTSTIPTDLLPPALAPFLSVPQRMPPPPSPKEISSPEQTIKSKFYKSPYPPSNASTLPATAQQKDNGPPKSHFLGDSNHAQLLVLPLESTIRPGIILGPDVGGAPQSQPLKRRTPLPTSRLSIKFATQSETAIDKHAGGNTKGRLQPQFSYPLSAITSSGLKEKPQT